MNRERSHRGSSNARPRTWLDSGNCECGENSYAFFSWTITVDGGNVHRCGNDAHSLRIPRTLAIETGSGLVLVSYQLGVVITRKSEMEPGQQNSFSVLDCAQCWGGTGSAPGSW